MTSPRPLIEEFIPVQIISSAGDREKKGGRDYHPSTLHWWWARRPLAAARAAILAALVPAQDFPTEREELERFFGALTSWHGDEVGLNQSILDQAKELISRTSGSVSPRVIDSFAGAGTIPLEALRLGCEAAAVEINPVAYLVAKATIVWPQSYGATLADDVQAWAVKVRDKALADLDDLYPQMEMKEAKAALQQLSFQSDNQATTAKMTPLVYLWTRTVECPNPALEKHEVPLVRSKFVVRKERKRIGLRVAADPSTMKFRFELDPNAKEAASKKGKSSASACPLCGAHISANYLKSKGDQGQIGHRLMAVVLGKKGERGKYYVSGDECDSLLPSPVELEARLEKLATDGFEPPEDAIQPMGNAGLASGETYLYGIKTFADVFTRRQLVTLLTLCREVGLAREEMVKGGMEKDRADVVAAYIGLIVNRAVDRSTSLTRWHLSRETAESPFVRDRLAMIWDYAEVNPFAGVSGDYTNAIDSVCKVIRHGARIKKAADLRRGSATDLPFPRASFDAAVIDPPYYDNISYANSSDFYYVWLKRSIGDLFPEHFAGPVAPKKNEIIAAAYRHGKGQEAKEAAKKEYEEEMTRAFDELKRVLRPGAPLVVVYAHQTTAGWSSLIQGLRRAEFMVTEAWPIDTEMTERRGGQNNASLASSIFLVARPRELKSKGAWADVENELKNVIRERVDSLVKWGVSGADLVIASIGAGLRPYTKFREVELPNGELMEPESYLDEVQTMVVKTVLADLMGQSPANVEAVDPITQLYVMGRFQYGDALVPFDELNTMARGILAGSRAKGVELLGPRGLNAGKSALIEKTADKLRLRDFEDRGGNDSLGLSDGADSPLIDVLHRLLWISQKHPTKVKEFLGKVGPDSRRLRSLAQALSGKGAGTSSREQAAIASLLASWKRLIDDNLFNQAGTP